MERISKLRAFIVAIALVLSLVPAVALADTSGTASGEFPVSNVDPANVSVELWTTGGTPATTTSMTPQVEYNAKVYVEDANTLDDLSTVTVRIFYDSNSNYSAGDEAGAADTQTRAILTWTNATPNTWTIDPSASTSWTIEEGNCVEPTLTGSSGTFEFHFKPGKVATENVSGKWHLWAEADDGGGGTPSTNTDQNKDMNWYGEVTVNTGTITWSAIAPGADFGDPTKQTSISVSYIANGAYDEQVASSSTWAGASATATLEATGNPGVSEFSLKAYDADTLGSAVLVDATPTYTTVDATGTQTGESGDTVTTNTLWLSLGTPFAEDTYAGTIYYQIYDGS